MLLREALALFISEGVLRFDGATMADAGVFTGQDNEKLGEILQMLLAAGYFRARIPALSTFDKILGGLAWSISASNVEVNIDVVFADSFTIGQKMYANGRSCWLACGCLQLTRVGWMGVQQTG